MEEKHRHRVMRGEGGEGFQAEGTVWRRPEGVEGGHVGAAPWLEARPCRRWEMFRKDEATQPWKDMKVLLLFWGTAEGFLSFFF